MEGYKQLSRNVFARKTISRPSTGPIYADTPALKEINVRYKFPFAIPEPVRLPTGWMMPKPPSGDDYRVDLSLEQEVLKQANLRRKAIAGEMTSPHVSLTPEVLSSVPLIPYLPSTILTPTPVAPKQNENPNDDILLKPLGELSLRDFESDANDPFENAALQAIDDMSELQSVLQPELATPTSSVNPMASLYPSVAPRSTSSGGSGHSSSADLLVNVGPNSEVADTRPTPVPIPRSTPVPAPRTTLGQPSNIAVAPIPAPRHIGHVPTPATSSSSPVPISQDSSPSSPPIPVPRNNSPRPSLPVVAPKPLPTVAPKPHLSQAQTVTTTPPVRPWFAGGVAVLPPIRQTHNPVPTTTSLYGTPTITVAANKSPRYSLPDIGSNLTNEEQESVRNVSGMGFPAQRVARYSLPDISSSLTNEEWESVRNISGMGFPAQRVARVFKYFNGEDQKVFDFLIAIGQIEDKGYNGDSGETALLLHNQDVEKSINYLRQIDQYKEVWDEESIHKAYKQASGDWDQTIDILTQGR